MVFKTSFLDRGSLFPVVPKAPATPDLGARKYTACKTPLQLPLLPAPHLYLQNVPRLGLTPPGASPPTCSFPFSPDRDRARHDPCH